MYTNIRDNDGRYEGSDGDLQLAIYKSHLHMITKTFHKHILDNWTTPKAQGLLPTLIASTTLPTSLVEVRNKVNV